MNDARLFYGATARNRDPILDVLRDELPAEGTVLEVASGSGEHTVHFAAAYPRLNWQPSDPEPRCRDSIAAWTAHYGLTNVAAPQNLNVTVEEWPVKDVSAILAINMIHISPWAATVGNFFNGE